MYGVCLRYSENVDDANDILQEGFIKVYKNINKFRSEGSFEGWIRRIFINTSIEHFRKKIKFNNISEVQENTIEDESFDIFNSLSAKDIIKAIDQLSPGYKTVFNMHVIEGYSHKEIADILEITEGTSKSQLARAKGILKKLLATSISNSKK
jgi:RNA polymerase sigma-70 factor (ECF subfamily)